MTKIADMKALEAQRQKDRKPLDEIQKILAKRFPEDKYREFHGGWFHVSTARLGDPSWEVPIKPYGTPFNLDYHGVQTRGRWSAGGDAPADQVVCVVVSYPFGTPVKFAKLGREADPKDVQALLKAEFETWTKGLAEPPKPAADPTAKPDPATAVALADRKAWQEPQKRKVGDFARWFAAAQGAVVGGKRGRREWYAWDDAKRNATYVVTVRFDESALGKQKPLAKGESFVNAISQ